MSFGHWLNSLTLLDNVVILSIFAIGGWLSHLTMKGFRKIVERTNESPYAEEFRTSPFIFFAVAIPYTIILYRLLGITLSEFLKSIF